MCIFKMLGTNRESKNAPQTRKTFDPHPHPTPPHPQPPPLNPPAHALGTELYRPLWAVQFSSQAPPPLPLEIGGGAMQKRGWKPGTFVLRSSLSKLCYTQLHKGPMVCDRKQKKGTMSLKSTLAQTIFPSSLVETTVNDQQTAVDLVIKRNWLSTNCNNSTTRTVPKGGPWVLKQTSKQNEKPKEE